MNPPAPTPLLAVRRLRVQYRIPGRWPWSRAGTLRAVEELNFNLHAGQTLGVVGESGCGKSTLARTLIGLQSAHSGSIKYQGRDITHLDKAGWQPLRREIQMVFQDPLASLDPRMSIGRIIAEPLESLCPEMDRDARNARVIETMHGVGLSPELVNRYPHEFSGGQCQRVGIARALVVRPKLMICDEPVSALDVSVQAQIINLLAELRRRHGMAMIFIAHDLAVVRHLSQRVLVMYLGRMMEQADCETLFGTPAHPYTKALLSAIPRDFAAQDGGQRRQILEGEIPGPANPPPGCVFATRCPMADERCSRQVPHVHSLANGSAAACHYVRQAA
ncbi:MAG TPA: oligopeptide/dipeptide ABC transporter ATP-binding protein [Stenotrophobium sp.]|nr:oligopeptide/dipeptide ABC transporter ATP-binding protein [Stenotrophobium sp.]